MRKPLQYNVLLNHKIGYYCQPVKKKHNINDVPVNVGSFKACKKQADILNLQFEKI